MPEIPSNIENSKEEKEIEPSIQKRETGFSKLVGLSAKEEKKISDSAKQVFLAHSGKKLETGTLIEELEREKTPEEVEILRKILEYMSDFVKRYDGVPIEATLDHIHILEREKIDKDDKELLKKSNLAGGHSAGQQFVYVFDSGNNLINTQKVVHELMHFNSFQSWEKVPNTEYPEVSNRHSGFSISNFNKNNKEYTTYFGEINEAITEELLKKFDKEYFSSIPELQKYTQYRKDFVDKYREGKQDDIAFVETKQLESGEFQTKIEQYVYSEERKKLKGIIKDIYEKNEDKFESKEDIFNIFAKSYMSGKLLEVARLVEKTYGKRSFRKIGDQTKKK